MYDIMMNDAWIESFDFTRDDDEAIKYAKSRYINKPGLRLEKEDGTVLWEVS